MTQAAILRPITERLLRNTGIGQGMRELDVDCGAGDVSILAAGIVGPSGWVVGLIGIRGLSLWPNSGLKRPRSHCAKSFGPFPVFRSGSR
jgi:hypothetical protein